MISSILTVDMGLLVNVGEGIAVEVDVNVGEGIGVEVQVIVGVNVVVDEGTNVVGESDKTSVEVLDRKAMEI